MNVRSLRRLLRYPQPAMGLVDGYKLDRYDWIGAAIAIVGVLIIFYAPRSSTS